MFSSNRRPAWKSCRDVAPGALGVTEMPSGLGYVDDRLVHLHVRFRLRRMVGRMVMHEHSDAAI